MNIALVVALWVVVIGAAFWCLLKGGRAGGGCGGCCSGGGCGSTDGDNNDDLRVEVLEIKDLLRDGDCESDARLAKGQVWVGDFVHATFQAHWPLGQSPHPGVIDLVLGDHENGAGPDRRIGVSVAYRNEDGQGELSIIDATGRSFAVPENLGKALRRAEVAGTPLVREAFDLASCILRSLPLTSEMETVGHSN
jgi:hypothetical protein